MFERIRALEGTWEGTFLWTGARSDSGTLIATYSLTGNGSAMVENLIMGGLPSMTSVYHLDGHDLRVTHFCGAGNQPRLKASEIDAAHGQAEFSFVDITNLSSPNAGHVEGLHMRIISSDHLELGFTFTAGGKHSVERIDLRRKSA